MSSPSHNRSWRPVAFLLVAGLSVRLFVERPVYGKPSTPSQPIVARHFAEIEVDLSDSLTLEKLRNLPHAPGSCMKLLATGVRARAQLPATLVGDLIEQGESITVLRDFMLSEVSGGRYAPERSGLARVAAECSGEPVTAGSEVDVPIGELQWVRSDIDIADVPLDMMVTCIDVHFEIVHPSPEELRVDLRDQGQTHEVTLWFFEGGEEANIERTITGITNFVGGAVNQTWGLWATDIMPGSQGHIDNWWIKIYYEPRTTVPSHDEQAGAVPLEADVSYHGTTVGATGQYESRCGYRDVVDVWHTYTPARTGVVTVVVESEDMDTTLAVFDARGVELACCDDSCDGTNSAITMAMTSAEAYLIRVAGYDHEMGDYVLVVKPQSLALPAAPQHPRPVDGAGIIALPVVLSWNEEAEEIPLDIHPKAIEPRASHTAGIRGVYGRDDRMEEYEVADPDIRAAGAATAMFLYRDELVDNGNGTYQVQQESLAWWYEWLDPIGTGNSLCADEPFRDQPSVGTCTGVLVGPDLIATAAHCVACLESSELAVVFGFVMQDAETPTVTLSPDQVYWVVEVLEYQAGSPDWGMVRLDRPVVGVEPLPLRRTGKVADGQAVFMVGYPWGVPRKYATGAIVQENAESTFFQANVDAYRGNSGSPVINLDSMVVEGLLVRGLPSFAEDLAAGCDRSSPCPDTGCVEDGVAQWEDVTRAASFSALVPYFEVRLGTDPDRLEVVATGLVVPRFMPLSLRKDTLYYWQVVVRNIDGEVAGPLWSFRTTLAPGS